jgi:hypothetical protein
VKHQNKTQDLNDLGLEVIIGRETLLEERNQALSFDLLEYDRKYCRLQNAVRLLGVRAASRSRLATTRGEDRSAAALAAIAERLEDLSQ